MYAGIVECPGLQASKVGNQLRNLVVSLEIQGRKGKGESQGRPERVRMYQ